MRAIMVMFDSLNRHFLPNYGCDWTHAPNFRRLGERTVTFDQAWVGSMPCMPARRELHTGRYNFLHRAWGPLEPFDDSAPEIMKESGTYCHFTTDHQHYFEDGGSTFHARYNTWNFHRGHEGDAWKGEVADPELPKGLTLDQRAGYTWRQDWVNRKYLKEQDQLPQAKTFADGIEFLRTNRDADNWFLQIETFDPHEPFYTLDEYKDLYPHEYDGPHFDWPSYGRVTEPDHMVQHMRYEYAATLSMCDHYLGQILDEMDRQQMWEDTMLIVTTDHGFLLGEHGWWAKMVQPFYNEVARIPFFVWDPRSGRRGVRNQNLVQNIDVPATLLEYFGIERPPDMQGIPLRETVADGSPTREGILFGMFGAHVNYTDGRYVYMRGPVDREIGYELNHYTLMATHMRNRMPVSELQEVRLAEPFSFTKGVRTAKISALAPEARYLSWPIDMSTHLFDLHNDPGQENEISTAQLEADLGRKVAALMKANDAPPEQFDRVGLS